MEVRCVPFLMSFVLFLLIGHAECSCPSLQHIVIGTTGVIQCSFEEGFFGVLWYNTTEILHQEAILISRNSEKSGVGYNAGEYDLSPNGSLIIYNVSKYHESNYTVILLKTTTDLSVEFNIDVLVNAETFIPYTRIDKCSDIMEVCFQQWDKNSEITCYVQDSRLMIPLKWMVRTMGGDRNISSNLTVTNQTYFTSAITTTNPFLYSSFLTLLVCKADDPMGLLTRTQSTVLILNDSVNSTSENIITKYLQTGSKMRLDCSDNEFSFLLWHAKETLQDKPTPVAYAVLTEDVFSHIYDGDYALQNDSSLVVHNVRTKHEGFYTCISSDGMVDDIIVYNVIAFALPVPAYPVIEGCKHEQHCILKVQREGSLTCTLTGILPRVQLDVNTPFHQSPHFIEFFDKQIDSYDNDGTFDVSLIFKYRVKETEIDRVTIECQVVGAEIDVLHLSTKFDLLFMTVESETLPQSSGHNWMIIVLVTTVLCLIVLCGIVYIRGFRKIQSINRNSTNDSRTHEGKCFRDPTVNEEEAMPMTEQQTMLGFRKIQSINRNNTKDSRTHEGKYFCDPTVNEGEAMPMTEQQTILEKKREQFIEEIRETYAEMYNGVQPIPYIREELCVNNVFIDSGIEYFNKGGGSQAGSGTWLKLDSYNSILTDPRLSLSTVFLLYGDPGYGKSTLALQFVYDWCNHCSSSPLKDVEMLIFLRLRYIKGGMNVFKAIKQFLLPADTLISERDIEDIFFNCNKVVIVFDGFDEYSYPSDGSEDDITQIIARKVFRNFKVILTTRPSRAPRKLSHATQRLRLTGFDSQAKLKYILKAVVDGNAEAAVKIMQRLQQNPILADICQVTLFFVMFAHITYEEEASLVLDSVTSFFRYIMACFYEHKQIKSVTVSATMKSTSATKHHKLDKVAFESLQGMDQHLVWSRNRLVERIDEPLYNELVEIGILVEENVVRIVDEPGTYDADLIQRRKDVSFYHKLFCEWYAAHYVAEHVNRLRPSKLQRFFKNIDPFDWQYVYRIACGLNPVAADKIIQYLHSIEGGDKFAILCILEQTGQVDKIKDIIHQMCVEGVIISGYDSLLLQRSSMQLLEIASRNEIPIEYVFLDNCLQSVDLSTPAIRTTSGLALTSRIPVKELVVHLYNRDMTEDEAIDILQFASMCPSLRELSYWGCVPPRSFNFGPTLSSLKSRDVTVRWKWVEDAPCHTLNLQSGRWENDDDGLEPTEEDFERMLSKLAEWRTGRTEIAYREMVKEFRENLRKLAEQLQDIPDK